MMLLLKLQNRSEFLNKHDYDQIEFLKNITRALQEFVNSIDAVKSGYTIGRTDYERIISSSSIPEIIPTQELNHSKTYYYRMMELIPTTN